MEEELQPIRTTDEPPVEPGANEEMVYITFARVNENLTHKLVNDQLEKTTSKWPGLTKTWNEPDTSLHNKLGFKLSNTPFHRAF